MKLNKRYIHNIRKNLSFYISTSVLTMVTLLLFYLFYIAGTGISEYGDEFFLRNKVEDASFSTLLDINDEELLELEEDYNVQLEKELYVNTQESDGMHVRVFKSNENIDLCEVIEGTFPTNNNETIISAGYAKENDILIGDEVCISGNKYKVSGFFLRPDYLYMLENLTDDYKNVSTFFLAVLNDDAFYDAFKEPSVSYKIIYNDTDTEYAFRNAINDKYYTLSYLSADENKRITFVHEQSELFVFMSFVMLIILPFITVALISIIIGRKISSEQKIIGTLSALGYKRSTLMWHYSLIAIIPGLIGGILMTFVTFILKDWFGSLGLADYEPLQPIYKFPLIIAIAGIIVPTTIYLVTALIKVRKLLKNDTVELLNGVVGKQSNIHRMFANTKLKVRNKFALRSVLGNPGRSFVVLLGIFLGAMIVSFSYIFVDSIKSVGTQAMSEIGSFEYEYILNTVLSEKIDDADTAMIASYENESGSRFSLMGVDTDCRYLNLIDNATNTRANIEDGWYITSLCAKIFDLKAGDEFTFHNIANLKEYTITIMGIIDNGYQNYVVSTFKNTSEITGFDVSYYNCILSNKPQEFDSNIIQEIITKDTFKNQAQTMLNEMNGLIYALIIIGAIICISSLYVAINMLVSENAINISMLKVLGYNRAKIDSMVLNGNHLLLIPGIILGMLAGYVSMVLCCESFVEIVGIIFPVIYSFQHIILTIIIVITCYFTSMFLVRRNVDKIDMIESLKDNRD